MSSLSSKFGQRLTECSSTQKNELLPVASSVSSRAAKESPSKRLRTRFPVWDSLLTQLSTTTAGRKKAWQYRGYLILTMTLVFAIIVASIWFSFVTTLVRRLKPQGISNGLQNITHQWRSPSDSMDLLSPWPMDFSQDIKPIHCHSHNDYWRRVPLFNALNTGCISVEADIWLQNSTDGKPDLLVGHSKRSLTIERSLQNLYLNPLLSILSNQNLLSKDSNDTLPSDLPSGVFESSPDTSLTLLLDFKSDGPVLWPLVLEQLAPLLSAGYLTRWSKATNKLESRPLTIVATGNAPFPLILAEDIDRYVFFDAPLTDISNSAYTSANSYLASASLGKAVGMVWAGRLNQKQRDIVRGQVKEAGEKGLKARYWNTPAWPIMWRNNVWKLLLESGVGLLNVDDLTEAGKWNWDWCMVAGMVLC